MLLKKDKYCLLHFKKISIDFTISNYKNLYYLYYNCYIVNVIEKDECCLLQFESKKYLYYNFNQN